MKRFNNVLLTIGLALGVVSGVAVLAGPADLTYASAAIEIKKGQQATNAGNGQDFTTTVQTVINMLLFIIGLVAVIVIIYSGIKFVLSSGDSNAIKSARDTMLYAVIGLVVAIMAYAVVGWVVSRFK